MTIKCIRCGNIEESAAKYIGVWIIKYGVNGALYDSESFVVGLCPDCQLTNRESVDSTKNLQLLKNENQITIDQALDKIWDSLKAIADTERKNTEKDLQLFQQHEMNLLDIGARLLNVEEGMSDKAYNNLLGCLTTIEKRTAKLEREMDRVWEIIRFHGDKFE